jgi:bifunctional enzyme CysN/CysC
LDGLQDEREQGITIDVAHRYINFKNQRLVFHDSPGHNQYTRNVVTAASNCDVAILLVDIKKGVTDQTKRHLRILDFLNIKNIIFVVNKIDLVKYSKKKFLNTANKIKKIINFKKNKKIFLIPTSALNGDNVVTKSKKIYWYKGKSLMNLITSLESFPKRNIKSYLSVQHIHRPTNKIRNYLGDLMGHFKIKQKVKVLPSENFTFIKNIYSNFKKINKISNFPVALDLQNQIDISRGDIICDFKNTDILAGNVFNAEVVITSSDKLVQGRQYLLRIHNKITNATVIKIKSCFDFNLDKYISKNELEINDIGQIEFSTNDIVPFSKFEKIPELARFVLIDKISFSVVCAGKINFALNRSRNIFKTEGKISKEIRAKLKRQIPKCIWLTGLSGSGKSTIAQNLEKQLNLSGKHTYVLDGDNLRLGINKNLGFTASDRVENVRRIAEISRLMVDAGLIVIVASISPFRKERDFARSLFEKNEFFEIYINTPLKVCMQRDSKNIYKKVKSIKNFSKIGLTGDYEAPINPDIIIDASKESISNSVNKIIKRIF